LTVVLKKASGPFPPHTHTHTSNHAHRFAQWLEEKFSIQKKPPINQSEAERGPVRGDVGAGEGQRFGIKRRRAKKVICGSLLLFLGFMGRIIIIKLITMTRDRTSRTTWTEYIQYIYKSIYKSIYPRSPKDTRK
jgi:hypothetical protein